MPRFEFLQALVTEFQDTANEEAKEQILANLANFAYDPINYTLFRKLNIIDLFLDMLTEPSPKLVEFALGGLCNCCLDSENLRVIVENKGIPLIIQCLSSEIEHVVCIAITALTYLVVPETREEILTKPVLDCMRTYSASSRPRLRNLAQAFLEEHDRPWSKR